MSLGSQAITLRCGKELSAQEAASVSTNQNNEADAAVTADDSMESVINFLEQTKIQDGSEEDDLIVTSQVQVSTPQPVLQPPKLIIKEDFAKARTLSNRLDFLVNKLVRFESHEEFLRICLEEGLVPAQLKVLIEPNIGNRNEAFLAKFYGIIKNFQNALIDVTAEFCTEMQVEVSKDIEETSNELKTTVNEENFDTVVKKIEVRKQKAVRMLKYRKSRKLNAIRYGSQQEQFRRPWKTQEGARKPLHQTQQFPLQNQKQLAGPQNQKPLYADVVQRQVVTTHHNNVPNYQTHHNNVPNYQPQPNPTVNITDQNGQRINTYHSNVPNYQPHHNNVPNYQPQPNQAVNGQRANTYWNQQNPKYYKNVNQRRQQCDKGSFENFLNGALGQAAPNTNQAWNEPEKQMSFKPNNQPQHAPNYVPHDRQLYNNNVNTPNYEPKNLNGAFPERTNTAESKEATANELQTGLQSAFQVLHALEAKLNQFLNH